MASPALMSATPMSVVSTAAHTPLNQPAQFQFHMPSPCSMPLPISAMDMASVPANNAGGPYGIGSAFMGPHTAHLGEAAHAGIDGTPMFGDAVSTSDPLYATRRSNMHPRISWHGSESMNQAFAGLQHPGQQCHPNSLGVTMGPESMDIGLTMLGDGHGGMCMAGDGAVNTTPVDWAMFAGMSAPHPIQTDMSMNTPQLHHMSSISTIDASSSGPQSQQRPAGTSGIDAAATTSAGSASGPGIMALYDEVLRDSSSLMNVFGQDLSGWQCPTKTNTIDPAALCAHQVAVVVLPAPGAAGKGAGGAFRAARLETIGEEPGARGVWVDCRSMMLGIAPAAATPKGKASRRHSAGFGAGMSVSASWSARTRVVDVMWHPLSTTDSHLLVLQANGTVKLFDVSEDADTPEQTLSLFSAAGAGSAGFAMSRAVSFCMGSASSAGWSRATLYVLTNTGELYSLCPVLPRRCSLDHGWLEDLLETVEMDVREWQAEEYETSECIYTPPELIAARAAAKWLNQVLDLDASKASERLHLALPDNLMQPVAAQGPYLFQPEPMPAAAAGYDSDSSGADSDAGQGAGGRAAECDPDDACSVRYMESASGLGMGLVAIAYCDAHVEVFADLEPVIGKWADTSARGMHMRDMPVLATLASVDLT
ncbi:hypothetical protein GGF43_005183, partial [Coemansia sp. RSA 2618]